MIFVTNHKINAPHRQIGHPLIYEGKKMFGRKQLPDPYIAEIKHDWMVATTAVGLVHTVGTASGTTVVYPKVVNVNLGPPTVLTVKIPPGLTVSDIVKAAPRIAPHVGAWGLRVTSFDFGRYAKVTLLRSDPLKTDLTFTPVDGILMGCDEDGELWVEQDFPHIIVQGMTRSGKSSWLYSVLSQWPYDIRGIDPSSTALRPFSDVVLGVKNIPQAAKYLARLVLLMDDRLGKMPVDKDIYPTDPTLIVLEEYPALLRAADAFDPKTGNEIRGHVARLLAESHKVGFRILIVCQRADASIVGGAERSQCGGKVSFRVDSMEALGLLHENPDPSHLTSPPGVALVSWPGLPTRRIKAPYSNYADFAEKVRAA